jgi:hypothetical protein
MEIIVFKDTQPRTLYTIYHYEYKHGGHAVILDWINATTDYCSVLKILRGVFFATTTVFRQALGSTQLFTQCV